jgi:hypothetical protein
MTQQIRRAVSFRQTVDDSLTSIAGEVKCDVAGIFEQELIIQTPRTANELAFVITPLKRRLKQLRIEASGRPKPDGQSGGKSGPLVARYLL